MQRIGPVGSFLNVAGVSGRKGFPAFLRERYVSCAFHQSSSIWQSTAGGQRGTRAKVQQLRDRLGSKLSDEFHSTWEDLWKDGLTPWDLGEPTPLLVAELNKEQTGSIESGRFRTLVPGCGRGYDIITLADHQDELLSARRTHDFAEQSIVVGLDVSPTSLKQATDVLVACDVSKRRTQVILQRGNFFDNASMWHTVFHAARPESPSNLGPARDEVDEEEEQFDFILDYTFFCALRPEMRVSWARRMKELLIPIAGRLLTIVYPILPNEDVNKGPPYPVTVDDYRRVLEPVGFEIESEPFESPHTVANRSGKEVVCFWRCHQGDTAADSRRH